VIRAINLAWLAVTLGLEAVASGAFGINIERPKAVSNVSPLRARVSGQAVNRFLRPWRYREGWRDRQLSALTVFLKKKAGSHTTRPEWSYNRAMVDPMASTRCTQAQLGPHSVQFTAQTNSGK
jgi:hypothetical protein